jgi:HAD superfamily hydrolase (TIGR01549 family)
MTPAAASSPVWLCDVNGVLIDSIALVRDAFAATARRFRIPLQEDGLRRVNGHVLPEAYRLLDPSGDPVASSRFHLTYLRERLAEMRAYDDVLETLAAAKAAGVRIAAVTSYGEIAEAALVHTGLYQSIDFLVTQEEVPRAKPYPDALILALTLLGRRGESRDRNALYVGDTVIDVQAGKAAGLRTIAVTCGAAGEAELRSAQPDDVIDRFGAIRALLPGSPARLSSARAPVRR